MTEVSFYILPALYGQDCIAADGRSLDARHLFVCRLCSQLQSQGRDIHIVVNDAATAAQLDEDMWSFRPERFLPHCTEAAPLPNCRIIIGHEERCGNSHDLLINLCHKIPLAFSRFERVVEIVSQAEDVLATTREHYRFYKDRHYPIKNHRI